MHKKLNPKFLVRFRGFLQREQTLRSVSGSNLTSSTLTLPMCSASLSVWFESFCVWSGLTDAGACPLCLWACHLSPPGLQRGKLSVLSCGMAPPACCARVECAGRAANAMEGWGLYLWRTLSACWHRSDAAHGGSVRVSGQHVGLPLFDGMACQ